MQKKKVMIVCYLKSWMVAAWTRPAVPCFCALCCCCEEEGADGCGFAGRVGCFGAVYLLGKKVKKKVKKKIVRTVAGREEPRRGFSDCIIVTSERCFPRPCSQSDRRRTMRQAKWSPSARLDEKMREKKKDAGKKMSIAYWGSTSWDTYERTINRWCAYCTSYLSIDDWQRWRICVLAWKMYDQRNNLMRLLRWKKDIKDKKKWCKFEKSQRWRFASIKKMIGIQCESQLYSW